MKIVIIGAGKVGYTLAQRLSEDDHDVIVIENIPDRISNIQNNLEVMVVEGNGASPEILLEVGMDDTDLFVAVTDSDEVNFLACYIARNLGAAQTIARVRANEYINGDRSDVLKQLQISLIINPEMVAANEILQILKAPNILDVEDFANGKIRLIETKSRDNEAFIGQKIKNLNLPPKILVVGILRHGRMIIPNGEDEVQLLDNLFLLGDRDEITQIEDRLSNSNNKTKIENVLIIGAGLIGRNLVNLLESERYNVKVIEKSYDRCELLSSMVDNAIIICGDGTDVDLLRNEEIGDNDVVICLTDDDKMNLLVALMARHFGVQKTFVRVGRPEYITLMEQVGIDIVFSPRLLTSGEILRQIRKGGLLTVSSFEDSKAEALEMELSEKNPLIGVPLSQVKIPGTTLLAAVVRGEEIIVPNGATICQVGDRVILFTVPEFSKQVISFMEG